MVAGIISIGDLINDMKEYCLEDLRGFFDVMEVYGSNIDIELGCTILEDNLVATDYLLMNSDHVDYREFSDERTD